MANSSGMRVLVAPDSFGNTLTAVQAAEAIRSGWLRRHPDAQVVLRPMADGGPGFVDVLSATVPGRLLAVNVPHQYGDDVPAAILIDDSTATAYVEAAQACGLHLTERRDPRHGTSRGVGRLVAEAARAGVDRIVVGLGGSATNDAGAGLLAELGVAEPASGVLTGGPEALEAFRGGGLPALDLSPARAALDGIDLIAATDVDSPLLGALGATATFGPQKGLTDSEVQTVDATLEAFAAAVDPRGVLKPGAGAAGGLGYALLQLGGRRVSGIDLVADAVGLADHARECDLVVTGEGSFDFQSRSGKVPYGVAAVAAQATRPCIALAGQVLVGSREMRAMGIESAYGMVDLVGTEASFERPAESLAALADRAARTWAL